MEKIDYDLVVYDNDIELLNTKITEFFENYDEKIEEYVGCIDKLLTVGITSGKVHENIEKFKEEVEGLKGISSELSKGLTGTMVSFLEEFDDADGSFYEKI